MENYFNISKISIHKDPLITIAINLIIMVIFFLISMLSLLLGQGTCGRTTNKYNSVPGGGFRHHGGFLGGYFDFYRGSRDNPADSFSDKYEDDDQDDQDNRNHHLDINYVGVSRPIEVYGINSQNYTDEVMDYEEDNLELSEENTADNDYIEEGKINPDDEYNDNDEYDIEQT